MAVTKDENMADTAVLPAVLGGDSIFRAVRDEQMGAVKNLSEAGLTRVVFVSTDRKGKFHVKVSVVSQDTRDAIVGLLDDEHVA
jgi:hypothetical protein